MSIGKKPDTKDCGFYESIELKSVKSIIIIADNTSGDCQSWRRNTELKVTGEELSRATEMFYFKAAVPATSP